MKLRLSAVILFSAWVGALAGDPRFVPGRVLLLPKSGTDRGGPAVLKRGHTMLKRLDRAGGMQVVRLAEGESVADAIAAYQATGRYAIAEPDYLLREAAEPNDPNYLNGLQWGLKNSGLSSGFVGADIHAAGGWDVLSDSGDVIVAVIDSGARLTHEDLAPNLWTNGGETAGNGLDDDHDGYIDDLHGINAITPSLPPLDDRGHGTHIAGIIGAVGGNGAGVSGVAWKTRLMILKFMDASGGGATSDAVECIDYARVHGAGVINASWGGGFDSLALKQALQRAANAGIVISNAAGNDSDNNDISPNYPGAYGFPNMVVVAATTRQDRFDATYSNFGATKVHLAAPGTSIFSTLKDSDQSYGNMSGTSMSCAFVSGAAALMRARFPDEPGVRIIQRMLATVDPLADLTGRCSSGGRLNLKRALGPSLLVSPEATLSFTIRAGKLPASVPAAYALTNLTAGPMAWSVASTVSWLAPDQAGGGLQSLDHGALGFHFTPEAASLPPGTYNGRLTFNSGLPAEAAFKRGVQLTVLEPVRLEVTLGPGGGPLVTVNASSAATLVTEASFNLLSWTPIQTNTAAGAASISVFDPQTADFPRRFYRVKSTAP